MITYAFTRPGLDWALLIETVYKYQTTWVGLANSPIPNGENVLPASATVMESVSGDELFYPMFLNAKPRAKRGAFTQFRCLLCPKSPTVHFVTVMEFVNGGELFGLLNRVGKLSSAAASFYISEILLAIEYFHSHNVLYRGVCMCMHVYRRMGDMLYMCRTLPILSCLYV